MSIIEKALDKALGRIDEAKESDGGAVSENAAASGIDQIVIADVAPAVEPSPTTESEPETQESDNAPAHALDWEALQAQGFLTPASTQGPLADSYRRIAQPVLFNAFPVSGFRLQRANLALVTSSRAGEGKTFTAINLALSVAMEQQDRKVLLIDANAANSSLSRLLGLTDRAGLANLLQSAGSRLAELMVKTDLPLLRILPFGQLGPKSSGMLAGAAMMKLAIELSKSYPDQLIIFDGPPLLEMAEAANLAGQVGQVLLVVEAETTPQVIVREAAAKLEYCNVVGCVLNKATETADADDLSFGYGLYRPDDSDG